MGLRDVCVSDQYSGCQKHSKSGVSTSTRYFAERSCVGKTIAKDSKQLHCKLSSAPGRRKINCT
jgi:hypothetical protein